MRVHVCGRIVASSTAVTLRGKGQVRYLSKVKRSGKEKIPFIIRRYDLWQMLVSDLDSRKSSVDLSSLKLPPAMFGAAKAAKTCVYMFPGHCEQYSCTMTETNFCTSRLKPPKTNIKKQ